MHAGGNNYFSFPSKHLLATYVHHTVQIPHQIIHPLFAQPCIRYFNRLSRLRSVFIIPVAVTLRQLRFFLLPRETSSQHYGHGPQSASLVRCNGLGVRPLGGGLGARWRERAD